MGYTGEEAAAALAAGQAARDAAVADATEMVSSDTAQAAADAVAFAALTNGVVAEWAAKEVAATAARALARQQRDQAAETSWAITPGAEGSAIQPLLAAQVRGETRARGIWSMFRFQLPGILSAQVSDRAVVFGVYSGAYLHGYTYLKEITYEALQEMVRTYDQAIAEMDAEEVRALLDAAAKRYAEEQRLAEKDSNLYNKFLKVRQKTDEVTARQRALEADIKALATKGAELGVVKEKAKLHIRDLENKLIEETLATAMADAEITRQELAAEKANLDVIETGIRALEIQSQIAEAAFRLASVPVRAAELASDIGRIELDTSEVEARKTMLASDIARIGLETQEVDVRKAGLQSDIGQLELNTAEVDVRKTDLASDTGRINLQTAEVPVRKSGLEADIKRMDFDIAETDVRKTMLESDIGRLDFEIEETGIRKTGLEADIGRINFDTEEVAIRKAQTNADTARLQAQAAMEGLTESELTVAKAETEAFIDETEVIRQRGPLMDQRIEAADVEITETIPRLAEAITKEKDADLASQEARSQHQVAELNNREAGYNARRETSNQVKELELANHLEEKEMIDTNADNNAILHAAQVNRVKNRNLGAEEAAKIMATAAIVNTLTHQIMPTAARP